MLGTTHAGGDEPAMVVPDYGGACLSNIIPALLEYPPLGDGWLPQRALDADQTVLLLIDGMGWNQLAARTTIAPFLSSSPGAAITTVAPSTTATALTSLTTGAAPGEHGLVGYRVRVGGETLNALRWSTESGDARERVVPTELQPLAPFRDRSPVVITKSEFRRSGFTMAHLDGGRFRGYGAVSTLVHEIHTAVGEGERFVYAYYDGLDRVGHERGHTAAFDAEFNFVDRLCKEIRRGLPDEVALLITADHGQVHTGDAIVPIAQPIMQRLTAISGEARFAWLHCAGDPQAVRDLAVEAHGDNAWVLTVEEVIEQQLLGPTLTPEARGRLGEVALIAKTEVAFVDPAAPESILIGRHGSLTADEVYVPLLCPE